MENIKLGAWIVGGIFGVCMAYYLFFGFLSWLFSDPLDIIGEPPKHAIGEDPDVVACREKGGLAIKSGWTGDLKECKF